MFTQESSIVDVQFIHTYDGSNDTYIVRISLDANEVYEEEGIRTIDIEVRDTKKALFNERVWANWSVYKRAAIALWVLTRTPVAPSADKEMLTILNEIDEADCLNYTRSEDDTWMWILDISDEPVSADPGSLSDEIYPSTAIERLLIAARTSISIDAINAETRRIEEGDVCWMYNMPLNHLTPKACKTIKTIKKLKKTVQLLRDTLDNLFELGDTLIDTRNADGQIVALTEVQPVFNSLRELERAHDDASLRMIAEYLAKHPEAGNQINWHPEFRALVANNGFKLFERPIDMKYRGEAHHNCVGSYMEQATTPAKASVQTVRLIYTEEATAEVVSDINEEGIITKCSCAQYRGLYNEEFDEPEGLKAICKALVGMRMEVLNEVI